MRKMVDSLEQPSLAQAQQIKAAGYDTYAFYVLDWAEGSIENIKHAGLKAVPIVAPSNVDGDVRALVDAGVAAAKTAGLTGVLALDTEDYESTDAALHPFVDGFCDAVRAVGWAPIIYSGAGYFGAGTNWVPSWTAPNGEIGPQPYPPDNKSGRQWAGNVSLAGVLVDLNVIGDDFPYSNGPHKPPGDDNVIVRQANLGDKDSGLVAIIQEGLKWLGFYPANGLCNGNYGPITDAAIRKFQEAHDCVPADGQSHFGHDSWQALANALGR